MSKPTKVFMVGACRASIFMNLIQKNGREIQMPKVIFQVRYRDKQGQWKGTNSLGLNDLPKAILALQKAYEYLTDRKSRQSEEQEPEFETIRIKDSSD